MEEILPSYSDTVSSLEPNEVPDGTSLTQLEGYVSWWQREASFCAKLFKSQN